MPTLLLEWVVGSLLQTNFTSLNWWIVFKDLVVDSRIKTLDTRYLVLHVEFEVKAAEHK